jgi:hypothetical protein
MAIKIESVKFGEVGWLYGTNIRSNSWLNPLSDLNLTETSSSSDKALAAKEKGLCQAMLQGWQSNQGAVTAVPVASYAKLHDITVDQLHDLVSTERKILIDKWSKDERYKHLAITAEKLWTGKVKFIANNCNRRSWGVIGAVDIMSRQPDFSGKYEYEIPIAVREFATKIELIEEHLLENTLKDIGRSSLTVVDLALAASKMLALKPDYTEASLQRAFGSSRGNAQAAHRLATLDRMFPQLKIVQRISLKENEEGYLPYGAFGKEEVARVIGGYAPDDKGKLSPPATGKNHAELAAKFVESIATTGKVTKPKMMTAPDIGNVLVKSGCYLLQRVGKAILDNDAPYFAKFNAEVSKVLNDAYDKLDLS